MAGKGIRSREEFSGDMDHFKVKVGKVNKPTHLAAVKRLGLSEVGEVLVVGEDLHWERGTVKIVAPGLQGANHCKEFAVVDVVVALGGGEQLRKIGTRVPVPIRISLERDGAGCVFRCIGGNGEGGR